jgi:uncharacterized protein YjbI with pentapeptide repeats
MWPMSDEQPDDSEPTPERQASDEPVFPDLQLGKAWGESITKARAAELEAKRQASEQEADHGERKGPFDLVGLTGADVFWLAARALAGSDYVHGVAQQMERLRHRPLNITLVDLNISGAVLWRANLSGALLSEANLSGANLGGANLAGANLARANLARADLRRADLSGAVLWRANLSGALLSEATLARAGLGEADLSDADLSGANLSGALLSAAQLRWADLSGANLARADLSGANLAGANLARANLAGANLARANLLWANLRRVTFDTTTNLTKVRMADTVGQFTPLVRRLLRLPTAGPISVADIHWNDVDLTVMDWSAVRRIGDERSQLWWWRTREESEQATRANTQLAKRLRDAGMNDDADRFAFRAQVCQRGVHLLRGRILRWLFSWVLFILAGYGYRPLRTLFWYLAVIGSFAFAFYMASRGVVTFGLHPSGFGHLAWYEALVLSVSSFHGRGFLPFPDLGDPVTILAAMEAVFGLFIEVSFIATFTQRYFGK